MNELKLVFLNTKYKKQYLEMIEECKNDIRERIEALNFPFLFQIVIHLKLILKN